MKGLFLRFFLPRDLLTLSVQMNVPLASIVFSPHPRAANLAFATSMTANASVPQAGVELIVSLLVCFLLSHSART